MIFCTRPLNLSRVCPIVGGRWRLFAPELSCRVFSRFEEVAEIWAKVHPQDVFLQGDYLQALEAHLPDNLHQGYAVLFQGKLPVGVMVLQLAHFDVQKSLRLEQNGVNGHFAELKVQLKKWLSSHFQMNVLAVGNFLLTGQHGFHFLPQVPPHKRAELIQQGIEAAKAFFESSLNLEVDGLMVKDLDPAAEPASRALDAAGWRSYPFQPNMVLPVRPDWTSFDDYLAALSSKYRVRFRRARKKLDGIQCREFDAETLHRCQDKVFALYQEVADSAEFSMTKISKGYLLALKQLLGPRFRLFAYLLNDEPVGFFTAIANRSDLEAHFIGFHAPLNRKHQLYLNMLYDLVALGIEGGFSRVVFARTALEIKSSVGAVPLQLTSFVRAVKPFHKLILPATMEILEPVEEWTPRHPFKEPELGVG